MIVLKFGGSSLATPERIHNACQLMVEAASQRQAVAIICSAFGDTTNQLIRMAALAANGDPFQPALTHLATHHRHMAHTLLPAPQRVSLIQVIDDHITELAQVLAVIANAANTTRAHMDQIMGFGERLAANTIYHCLADQHPVAYLNASAIIRTDARFGHARVDWHTTQSLIRDHFANTTHTQIVTGFNGSTPGGDVTTLGRGGSDYTAALIGAALGCTHIEIWTDVNGFMTADPNQVPEAFSPRTLTFEDALDLAYFGAKVIYPPTLIPAMQADVAVLIKNCFAPEHPGTRIGKDSCPPTSPITGIAAIDTILQVRIKASNDHPVATLATKINAILTHHQIPICLIRQTHDMCYLYLDQRQPDCEQVLATLTSDFGDITMATDKSLIALVGDGLDDPNPYLTQITQLLASHQIPIHTYGQCRSNRNICIILDAHHQQKAQRLLHKTFLQNTQPTTSPALAPLP